jgi:hypothetical protein
MNDDSDIELSLWWGSFRWKLVPCRVVSAANALWNDETDSIETLQQVEAIEIR